MASINSSVVYTEIHTLATNKAAPDEAWSRIDQVCNDTATSQLTANVRVMSGSPFSTIIHCEENPPPTRSLFGQRGLHEKNTSAAHQRKPACRVATKSFA